MGAIAFFTNWQLWQQMTFVLACCIVITFFVGLGKLWWMNRSVRKHELLDEEKRSRMTEIEKTGIPVWKRPAIPFGVRAIQSGIEIDGIWISRPGTPNSECPLGASSLTLASDHDPKGKSKVAPEGIPHSPHTSPTSSTFGPDATTPPRSPARRPQSTYRPKHALPRPSPRATESCSAEAMNRLQGTSKSPALQTYVPTTSFSGARGPASAQTSTQGDRTSSSSEEGYNYLSARIQTQRKSPISGRINEREGYTVPPLGSPENPFATPEDGRRTREPSDASSSRMPMDTQTQTMNPPARSYSSETYVNRSSRRVNPGFEVLPAGTFGMPDTSATIDSEVDLEHGEGGRGSNRLSRYVVNKLHKR
ncbi:hypothetical protein BJ170DRAFT_685549 [Xylariales sp. AK1849]|nr:hypothetical protein BJ170DRAFT_685549 [Xylariales sp. AK1849]